MKTLNAVVALLLGLAAWPQAGRCATNSDQAFFQELGGIKNAIYNEEADGLKSHIRPATQESGFWGKFLLKHSEQGHLIQMLKDVRPSVVLLLITGEKTDEDPDENLDKKPNEKPSVAGCSGFFVDTSKILDRKTVIATNSHCVEKKAVGDEIQVGLFNGDDNHPKMTKGKVLAFGNSDAAKDIAFVELADTSLNRPGLPLFWSKPNGEPPLEVGEKVVAVGNPLGLTFSASQGSVSALERDRLGTQFVLDLTQSDVAVNPGNSGGPLFNLWGSVVGINSMSATGGIWGISFSLPARYIVEALKQYHRTGNLAMGTLGIAFEPDKDNLKLTVSPKGAAAAAGLLPTDKLVRIDDIDLEQLDPKDVIKAVSIHVKYMSPGEKTSITVRREGQVMSLEVTLAEYKKVEERPKWADIPPQPKPKPQSKQAGWSI